jgi:hypothetical protein
MILACDSHTRVDVSLSAIHLLPCFTAQCHRLASLSTGYLWLDFERVFGRPPSFPFSLAAFALAFDLAEPPSFTI